jgi:hypothetical protein
MSDLDISKKSQNLALTALMIFIWLVLGMVYMDRFIPPFDRLELRLMPWKGEIPPGSGLDKRLSIMQDQLDASNRISTYALVTMIVSFAAFIMYLSVIYQQKQRRARENMFLVLKNQLPGLLPVHSLSPPLWRADSVSGGPCRIDLLTVFPSFRTHRRQSGQTVHMTSSENLR